MKMIYAGLASSESSASEFWRYNCTRNKNCQKEFYVPISSLCDFMLFAGDLPFEPVSYEISVIDSCTGDVNAATVIKHVIAHNTIDIYAVISGLQIVNPLPHFFYIQLSFFDAGSNEAIYYTHDFEVVTCEPITSVAACYNDASIGTDAFDNNDVYYGYPLGTVISGSARLRYYHFARVRKSDVIQNKRKLTLSLFNEVTTYRAKALKEAIFQSEIVPEFYMEELFAIVSRGTIDIGGKAYTVAEETELDLVSEDSKWWDMRVGLRKVIYTSYSCKITECKFDGCIPEPACCTPTDIHVVSASGCADAIISMSFKVFCNGRPCSDGFGQAGGITGVEMWFTAPLPRDIVLYFGHMEEIRTYTPYQYDVFGYNMPFTPPVGSNLDPYYPYPLKGNPFVVRAPAGATHFVYSMYGCTPYNPSTTPHQFCGNYVYIQGNEPVGGTRQTVAPQDVWKCFTCCADWCTVKYWVRGECLNIDGATNVDGVPVEIVNID